MIVNGLLLILSINDALQYDFAGVSCDSESLITDRYNTATVHDSLQKSFKPSQILIGSVGHLRFFDFRVWIYVDVMY